ncbi:MAG: hypothetical protein ABH816_01620 [Candidatus Levyibacteriota bacterium]
MKTKILVVLIILIVLGVGGFFVYKNMTGLKVEEGIVPAPATQVRVYKGIWTPVSLSNNPRKLNADMKKLKDMGMNTIFLPAAPPQVERCLEGQDPNSELVKKLKKILPIHREIMIANIQAAHRNGLRVGLAMTKCYPAANDITLEQWDSQVIENAKLAEKYHVELFAPMNEPEALFGPSASADWGQEILPKIKEVYHGIVIWKGASIGDMQLDSVDFSGYDYLGFSVGIGSVVKTLEEFPQNVDYALDTFLGLAERDGCKGVMITEFYGRLPYIWEERAWNEEKEARVNEIILEKGKNKVDGFFALDFLGLSIFGEDIPRMPDPKKSSKTQEVIKRWFTEIL